MVQKVCNEGFVTSVRCHNDGGQEFPRFQDTMPTVIRGKFWADTELGGQGQEDQRCKNVPTMLV